MRDLKAVIIALFLAVLLLPIGVGYAQEDVAVEEPILYEDTDYDYNYEFDTSEFNEMVDSFETIPSDTVEQGVAAGLFAAMAAYTFFVGIFGLAAYIFTALALQKIGKELNYENPWFAWIPILQTIMMFQLGGQNPWLLLLFLIPVIGQIAVLIFTLIALMNITEKRGYDKVLAILIFVPLAMYILFYLLAWKPKEVVATTTPTQPVPETK